MIDIAVIEDDDSPGSLVAHDPACPLVQAHRDQDRPICTMFGVKKIDVRKSMRVHDECLSGRGP